MAATSEQEWRDKWALRALLSRYSHAIDRHDYAMFSSIFTEDAWFEFNLGQVINRNRDDIVGMMRSLERYRVTMHFLGNSYIELHGDAAFIEAYGEAHHFSPDEKGGENDRIFGCRYLHQAHKVKGEWRVHRTDEFFDYRRDVACITPGPQRLITGWQGYQGDPSPAEATERSALRDLMDRYTRALDRGIPELLETVFTPDAYFEFNNGQSGSPGGSAIWRGLEQIKIIPVGLKRYQSTTHFLGPQYMEIHGDSARMESYGIAHALRAREGSTEQALLHGVRYIDDLEKIVGDWRIKNRIEILDWHSVQAWTEPVLRR